MNRNRKSIADTGGAFQPAIRLLSLLARLSTPKPWLAYAAAVLATALATVLRWWLGLLVGASLPPFITFYPVPMLAALLGGAGPGLAATVLVSLAVQYFFLAPTGSLAVAAPVDQVGLVLFCAVNLATTIICAVLRSARQRAFAEARRAQAAEVRYRRLFEAAHDGVLLLDTRSHKITDANPFITQLLGYPRNELLGKELWQIGLLQDAQASRAAFDQLATQGYIRYEDLPLQAKTGETREVEFVSTVYDEDGRSVIQCNIRDITYRKRAEAERIQAEQALRRQAKFIDLSPTATIVRNLEGRIAFWSAGAQALYGWTPAEAVGRLTHDLVQTQFPKPLDEIVADLRRDGYWSGELRHRAKDGRTVIVESHWLGQFAPDGQVIELMESNMDITARKQAENALRKSERQFRALAESVPQLVWTTDAQGQMDYVNSRWLHYTGQAPEKAHGSGWSAAIHPDDRSRALERWTTAAATGQVYEVEYRLRRDDGQHRWFLTRGVPVRDPQGRIERWFGTCTDIDEHKRTFDALQNSETRLLLALETAELGTYERDLLTNQVTSNEFCRRLFGRPDGSLPPDVAYTAVHPLDKERVYALVQRAFEPALREICAAEFRILRPDGSVRWVAGRGRVLFDDSVTPARPARFLGVLNDITERKRLQAELQRRADDLERTVQERTAKLRDTVAELEGFSYSLVHDLRAPLRAMLSYAGMLELEAAGRFAPEHADHLRRIKLAALRMDQLVTDSLNYSKILRQELPLGPVNLGALLGGMVETYPNLQAPAADITLEIAEVIVHGNQAALTQIFSNLLGNAVKFVAPGVHPRVRVWAQFPEPSKVLIWVEDNGIGIPKDQQDRIFGMFQRLHRADEYPGTGIGLALVRKSLDRTGGQVCLDSEPGRGSRFCVLLPLAQQEHQAHAE